jgi:hypothetical protein
MKALLVLAAFLAPAAFAAPAANQLEVGKKTIRSFAGCYLVDFNYTETEGLAEGYQRDKRVYNVNGDKSVKEWIFVNEVSPTRLRVQHVLFMAGLDGKVEKETIMKHTGDEWEFNASHRYDFVAPLTWDVNRETKDLWTRRITNLDDGLRYGCSAAFSDEAYPTWGCASYAPIPGRETRDMGRKDYNTMERFNKVVAFNSSWLEREYNTKVSDNNGVRTRIAKEEGRNFWIRLPDSDCADAKAFADQRKPFWDVTREVWDEVLDGTAPFREKAPARGASRYGEMMGIEDEFSTQDLSNPAVRAKAKDLVRATIEAFRVR